MGLSNKMLSGFLVRKASTKDFKDLNAIETSSFTLDRLSPRQLRYHLVNRRAIVLVAEKQACRTVAAYILVFLRSNSPARIYSVAVANSFRGHGLGKLLIKNMIDELKKRGVSRIRLEVRTDNGPAIELYKKMGFKEIARLPEYYSDRSEGIRFELTI